MTNHMRVSTLVLRVFTLVILVLWVLLVLNVDVYVAMREKPHMGLIYVVMCSHRGWCGWHFNHDGFGT